MTMSIINTTKSAIKLSLLIPVRLPPIQPRLTTTAASAVDAVVVAVAVSDRNDEAAGRGGKRTGN